MREMIVDGVCKATVFPKPVHAQVFTANFFVHDGVLKLLAAEIFIIV